MMPGEEAQKLIADAAEAQEVFGDDVLEQWAQDHPIEVEPPADLLCLTCRGLLVVDGDGWWWCHGCEDDVYVGECKECGGPPDQRVVSNMRCERCAYGKDAQGLRGQHVSEAASVSVYP
ncbi:hypothetical protein LCGC14_2891770 [marine sediment metagenome]|uniref:Uncharacterized protein n=1 Tax=marine sediment metagenome TaxID=412755 RepID=A0A0F8XX16_9ZZZZ